MVTESTAAAAATKRHPASSSAEQCCPLRNACPDPWTWNESDRSPEALLTADQRTVVFHPSWSNGTAAVRGSKPLDNNTVYYWEIQVSRRLFGTSVMFGVATRSARLHVDAFVNLLGEDEHSWALSHKGTIWHRGSCEQFTEPFRENSSTVVGLLFHGPRGSLTYFKDGVCLGVAFTGISTARPLFPIVSSTAAKTEMTLGRTVRSFSSLQDRCRAVVVRHMGSAPHGIDTLPIPTPLRHFIGELMAPADVIRRRECENEQLQCAVAAAATPARRCCPRISLKFTADATAASRYWPALGWLGELH